MDNRFSVESAFYPMGKNVEEKKVYLILDNGLPAIEVNRHLILQQLRYSRPVSSSAYAICTFMNFLDEIGTDVLAVKLKDIYDYLFTSYVDDGKSYKTIMRYITEIANMYESFALRNYGLDESILRPVSNGIHIKKNRRSESLTKIGMLRKEFLPKATEFASYYTKWYTKDEMIAISNELPLVHRCIFWVTILTGLRIDSALSITVNTVNLKDRILWPTRTKTKKSHVSWVPEMLAKFIEEYLIDERSRIVEHTESTSAYLFLSQNGSPVTYHAYIAALRRAGMAAEKANPSLAPLVLHSHAGRSTFAAALRSYQLARRRQNIETFTDSDFCNLMDWTSLQCLDNYDIMTRVQEVSPLLSTFFEEMFDHATANRYQSWDVTVNASPN